MEVKRNEVRGCGPCAWERGEEKGETTDQAREGGPEKAKQQEIELDVSLLKMTILSFRQSVPLILTEFI